MFESPVSSPDRSLKWISILRGSRHSPNSSLEPEKIPSMDESSDVEETPIVIRRRRRRKQPSIRDIVTPRNVILGGMLFMASQLLFGFCLHKAGVTETDVIEDFLAQKVLPNIENGWARINGSISAAYLTQERLRPGYQLAQQGAKAKYPIVMVPGFITSGLELWGGHECARKHFRQKLWGLVGAKTFLTDRDCFLKHLKLDPYTGSDPENIRLRAAQGFDAADYFMSTYWVWRKLIENLADVGYDASTMTMMTYDWRLAFPKLEERDGYLTKLKHTIEAMHKTNGKKVVLASHSMGSLLTLYFFAWVTVSEKDGGGGGGKHWVDEHIHSFVNIAGPLLGVPKSAPAILSGEMKDTSVLLGHFGSMVEQFFGRRLRKELWSSWGSLWSMLPKGGDAIWGSGADICDENSDVQQGFLCASSDPAEKSVRKRHELNSMPLIDMSGRGTLGETTKVSPSTSESKRVCQNTDCSKDEDYAIQQLISDYSARESLSVEETLKFLSQWGGGLGPSLSAPDLHFASKNAKPSHKTWHDPSLTPLPHAPSMKVYCMYGTGIKTERAYFYKQSSTEDFSQESDENTTNRRNLKLDLPFIMDTTIENEDQDIRRGVKFADGDGSVPLLSSGYMCVNDWKTKRYNPSGAQVTTREYFHRQEFVVEDPMRGGPRSSDHVDILGNVDMTEDFLRIVTNFEDEKIDDHIVSNIKSISNRIATSRRGRMPPHQKLLRKIFK
mmetsp:Transcript_25232/g.35571  ORF Transcript_25232/g.35571 Transcript_25232/m.35571 type:complete len:726 (-) Transcript_25232:35-2212(-)